MEELVRLVAEKASLAPAAAKKVVTNIFGYLKGKLPAAEAGQLEAAVGGGLSKVAPLSGDLTEVLSKAGLAADKIPAVLQTDMTQRKDKVPAGLGEQIQNALVPGGEGILAKVAGWFGGKS
jgi:hypothetical protein